MNPETLTRLEELLAKASPGPWTYNSYSEIFSVPLVEKDDAWPDDMRDGDVSGYQEDFYKDALSSVAHVPAVAGDTATGRHKATAELIVAAVNALPALLQAARELERVTRDRTAYRHFRDRAERAERERNAMTARAETADARLAMAKHYILLVRDERSHGITANGELIDRWLYLAFEQLEEGS